MCFVDFDVVALIATDEFLSSKFSFLPRFDFYLFAFFNKIVTVFLHLFVELFNDLKVIDGLISIFHLLVGKCPPIPGLDIGVILGENLICKRDN